MPHNNQKMRLYVNIFAFYYISRIECFTVISAVKELILLPRHEMMPVLSPFIGATARYGNISQEANTQDSRQKMPTSFLELMELLSYVATVIGIPLAIVTFMAQERKERQSEQEEIYDQLMDHYDDIKEKLFEYPELDQHDTALTDPESFRRQRILYEMLISLFERAFILLHGETDPAYRRMWNSWIDYIEYWTSRPNFREALPDMMRGEDPDFTAFIAKLTDMDLKP